MLNLNSWQKITSPKFISWWLIPNVEGLRSGKNINNPLIVLWWQKLHGWQCLTVPHIVWKENRRSQKMLTKGEDYHDDEPKGGQLLSGTKMKYNWRSSGHPRNRKRSVPVNFFNDSLSSCTLSNQLFMTWLKIYFGSNLLIAILPWKSALWHFFYCLNVKEKVSIKSGTNWSLRIGKKLSSPRFKKLIRILIHWKQLTWDQQKFFWDYHENAVTARIWGTSEMGRDVEQ